ncbi:hypothetical protein [Flavobacterium sp. 5]|nr:hypothetical protein [Flavobacterium sp. 5]
MKLNVVIVCTQRFPPLPPQTRLEEQEAIIRIMSIENTFFISG